MLRFIADLYIGDAEIEASGGDGSFAVTVEIARVARPKSGPILSLTSARARRRNEYGPVTWFGNFILKDPSEQETFADAVRSSASLGEAERLRLADGREALIEIDLEWFEGLGRWPAK